MSSTTSPTQLIRTRALQLGFDACGFAKAGHVGTETETHIRKWLDNGMQAEMGYMDNYFDKRCDTTLLVDGAKTVISLAINYFPKTFQSPNLPQIACYAYGKDYHTVVKEKLAQLLHYIREEIDPAATGRAFTDSAPVAERYWAQRAGLGWIGKNNSLIIPGMGSFFFLAELIISTELEYNTQNVESKCGACRRCINSCPTGALEYKQLDARKCLSYLTIEKRDELNADTELHNRAYGCDICLLVCPWNRFARPNTTPEFAPIPEILSYSASDWLALTEEDFNRILKFSPIKRTKYAGLMRNIRQIML